MYIYKSQLEAESVQSRIDEWRREPSELQGTYSDRVWSYQLELDGERLHLYGMMVLSVTPFHSYVL